MNCGNFVRQAATQMGDTSLLAKLSEGGIVARKVCYHEHCMTKFRNKFLKFFNNEKNHVKDVQESLEVIVVGKYMTFVENY